MGIYPKGEKILERNRDPMICRLTALDAAEKLRKLMTSLEPNSILSQILSEAQKNLCGLDTDTSELPRNVLGSAQSRPHSKERKKRLIN